MRSQVFRLVTYISNAAKASGRNRITPNSFRTTPGCTLGLSSGINIAGAVRLALERGPGQTIATVLCDSGAKYQSKLFNREWQAANGLRADVSVDTLVAKS